MSKQSCTYLTVESWSFNKIHLKHKTAVCNLCLGKDTYISHRFVETGTCQAVLLRRAVAAVLQEGLAIGSSRAAMVT